MPVARTVFLDTQVFEQEFFNFESSRFSLLKRLVSEGHAKVVITEITRREVVARIRETAAKALQALKLIRKKRRSVGLLWYLGDKFANIFIKHNPREIAAEVEKQFEKLRKDLRVEEIPLEYSAESLSSIVDDYFEMRPPFRKGRKRHEFPDAISCDILRKWATSKRRREVFVVTGDQDWQGLCTNGLVYLETLVAFLAIFPDRELADQLIVGLRGPSHDLLCDKFVAKFKDLDFVALCIEGEVIDVNDVHVSFDDIVIVEARDGHAVAEITCDFVFRAEVNYEREVTEFDFRRGDYERVREQDTATVTCEDTYNVEIEFEYDKDDPTSMVALESYFIDAADVEIDCRDLVV
jgi:hypothetical protein